MTIKGSVGKGAIYLYVEAITMMFSGYLYWLILSKITDSAVIGSSATAIAIATIFMVVSSVGIAGGIQSYMGKSINNKSKNLKQLINSSMLILFLGITGTIVVIVLMSNWLIEIFNIEWITILLIILIVGLTSIANLLRALIVPSLRTQFISTAVVAATIAKIVLTVSLVLNGYGVTGVLLGFILNSIVLVVIQFVAINRNIYQFSETDETGNFFVAIKDIFYSSLGFWIPGIFNTIGSQLGTIAVFISNGSSTAGIYFIAFSIVTGISMIMLVLSTLAYPVVGSMKDGRKLASWKLIKISLLLTIPLSTTIFLYAPEVLGIFGMTYVSGSVTLQILLLTILPTTIFTGINVLVYAYGNNKQVLIIGLLTSIPRTVLYFVFVPIFEGEGAALTYLIGSLLGAFGAVIISQKIDFKLNWREIFWISFVPILFALGFRLISINFVIEICCTLLLTYIALIRFKIVTMNEIKHLTDLLPSRISDPLNKSLDGFYRWGR